MQIRVTEKKAGFGLISVLFLVLLAMATAYSFSVFHSRMIWFGVGACLISAAGFTRSLWKQDLLMQIDDTGIYDRRLGLGKIAWVDVEDVQLQVTETNRFLCFRMLNPEPYLARLKGANRERVLFHRSLGFNGFNIDVGPMDVNLLELKKHIDARVATTAPHPRRDELL